MTTRPNKWRRFRKSRMVRYGSRVPYYLAKVAALSRTVAYLSSVINVEKKYVIATGTATNINAAGALTLLNGCSEGDDENSRSGQSIKSQRIFGRVKLNPNTGAASPPRS